MTERKSKLSAKPIEKMNIHEKRKYAKYIGVKSPTILSLSELDEAIRLKEVEIGSLKEFVGIYDMMPYERQALESLINAQSRVTRAQSGYYYPFPEGDGVLRYETFKKLYERDIYVPAEMAENYGLRFGDLVSGDIITVVYNKTNIMRTIKHINDHPAKNATLRPSFSSLHKLAPTRPLKLYSNNSVIGLMTNFIYIGEGQSVAADADDETAETIAYDLMVSLYRSFDGQIFCIYDPIFENNSKMIYNPFACTNDVSEDNISMLVARVKRLVESGVSAAIVAYTRKESIISELIKIAGNYSGGSLTVLICGGGGSADAVVTIRGDRVIACETVNRYAAAIAGRDAFRKLLALRETLSDGFPDDLLAKVNDEMLK